MVQKVVHKACASYLCLEISSKHFSNINSHRCQGTALSYNHHSTSIVKVWGLIVAFDKLAVTGLEGYINIYICIFHCD